MNTRIVLLPILVGLLAAAGSRAAELEFRLGVSRTHNADHDTILVVATARNPSATVFKTWGLFDYRGGYQPTAETFQRWRAIRDSALAAAARSPGAHFRDLYPRLPTFILISRTWGAAKQPLKAITLAPGEAYTDTLVLDYSGSDFHAWPGYIDVAGTFLVGTGPDTTGAVRLGNRELRIAVPVP